MADFCNFVILDGERMLQRMHAAIELSSNSLNMDPDNPDGGNFTTSSPYLIAFESRSTFATWLHNDGWGDSWGVFIQSHASLSDLRMHFRKFLTVKTDSGVSFSFRYYDPRVLRVFIPSCTAEQLKEFFGPVTLFAMEDEDPSYCKVFKYQDGILRLWRTSRSSLINGFELTQKEYISGVQPRSSLQHESQIPLSQMPTNDVNPTERSGIDTTPALPDNTTSGQAAANVVDLDPEEEAKSKSRRGGFNFLVDSD